MSDVAAGPHRRIRAAYVPVVIEGRIAFQYDPYRKLVEWQHRGIKYIVDLALLDAKEDATQSPVENIDSHK